MSMKYHTYIYGVCFLKENQTKPAAIQYENLDKQHWNTSEKPNKTA